MMGLEPRQSTSNVGHLGKPSIQALIHGLNRHYYSIAIAYRKTDLEQSMLLNLHKKNWTEGLRLNDWVEMKSSNEESIKVRLSLLLLSLLFPLSFPPPLSDANTHRNNSECSTYRKRTQPQSKKNRLSPPRNSRRVTSVNKILNDISKKLSNERWEILSSRVSELC